MKITGTGAPVMTPAIGGVASTTAPAAVAAAGASSSSSSSSALQSDVLQPAAQALRSLPDFDAARVAELRDALAKGELPFDASRLAGLIQRFHGGHG